MSKHDATQWYSTTFKAWPAKLVGAKPSADQLDTIHKLGARPGKQALANAMMLRECGVTGSQIVIACGAPQLNKMRDLIAKGLMKSVPISKNAVGHTVYKLALTARGLAKVAKAVAVTEAAPVKAAKPRKAKAVAEVAPVVAVAAAEVAEANAQPQA